jgi:hypothetical protein
MSVTLRATATPFVPREVVKKVKEVVGEVRYINTNNFALPCIAGIPELRRLAYGDMNGWVSNAISAILRLVVLTLALHLETNAGVIPHLFTTIWEHRYYITPIFGTSDGDEVKGGRWDKRDAEKFQSMTRWDREIFARYEHDTSKYQVCVNKLQDPPISYWFETHLMPLIKTHIGGENLGKKHGNNCSFRCFRIFVVFLLRRLLIKTDTSIEEAIEMKSEWITLLDEFVDTQRTKTRPVAGDRKKFNAIVAELNVALATFVNIDVNLSDFVGIKVD